METRRIFVLGVPFDTVSPSQALLKLHYYSQLPQGEQYICTTPNPEMIVQSLHNAKFLSILRKSNLSLADGTGILWASGFLSLDKVGIETSLKKKLTFENFILGILSLFRFAFDRKNYTREIKRRVTGVDIFGQFLATSQSKVFLLGGKEGAAEEIANQFSNVVGFYDNFVEQEFDSNLVQKVNDSGAVALFVALGSPKQELWIARNISAMPNIRFAMGVGGAFDFLTGRQKRAPQWMQTSGLEWVYRLLRNPVRAGRIFNATIRFFLCTVRERYQLKEGSLPTFSLLKEIFFFLFIIAIVLTIILTFRLVLIFT